MYLGSKVDVLPAPLCQGTGISACHSSVGAEQMGVALPRFAPSCKEWNPPLGGDLPLLMANPMGGRLGAWLGPPLAGKVARTFPPLEFLPHLCSLNELTHHEARPGVPAFQAPAQRGVILFFFQREIGA